MIRVGKIVASHGLKGSVIFTHIVGKSDWLKINDVIFLEINKESFIPFFISSVKVANDEEYIVTLEDVEDAVDAKRLVGKKVYVEEGVLSNHVDDSPLLWIGFNIVDKQKGSIGLIEDVLETGHQWLAKLTIDKKEVLIPLIDPMILDINVKNKFIRMDLPDGLLEL